MPLHLSLPTPLSGLSNDPPSLQPFLPTLPKLEREQAEIVLELLLVLSNTYSTRAVAAAISQFNEYAAGGKSMLEENPHAR